MTLHHENRGGILAGEVEKLLNDIASGNDRDVFKTPRALQALIEFGLVRQLRQLSVGGQPEEPSTFQVTPAGWEYVTCTKALALHRLQDPPRPPITMGDSRLGFPSGQFARALFAGIANDTTAKKR